MLQLRVSNACLCGFQDISVALQQKVLKGQGESGSEGVRLPQTAVRLLLAIRSTFNRHDTLRVRPDMKTLW